MAYLALREGDACEAMGLRYVCPFHRMTIAVEWLTEVLSELENVPTCNRSHLLGENIVLLRLISTKRDFPKAVYGLLSYLHSPPGRGGVRYLVGRQQVFCLLRENLSNQPRSEGSVFLLSEKQCLRQVGLLCIVTLLFCVLSHVWMWIWVGSSQAH